MHAIIELDVLGTIARAGPDCNLLASEIVARLPEVRNPMATSMLDRMLWLLATHKIVSCSIVASEDGDIKRKYGLTPVAKYFVPNEDGASMAPIMSMNQDKVFVDSWSKLKDAVLQGGIPFNMVHGMHTFEYLSVDPRFNKVFNKAMAQSVIFVKIIFKKYKGLESYNVKQLVDVGGGLGQSVGFITSQYPSIKGINFDLPHVIKDAPPIPGVEHVGGDMFENVPKGDFIFLKALPKDGKIIVVEAITKEELETMIFARAISLADLTLMTQSPGGKERSKREFEALAKAAGFSGIDFPCCVHRFWVMEFYK
ncbi:Caffeic acid 3-O-methyltransferase [Bienertia sinuspersici]